MPLSFGCFGEYLPYLVCSSQAGYKGHTDARVRFHASIVLLPGYPVNSLHHQHLSTSWSHPPKFQNGWNFPKCYKFYLGEFLDNYDTSDDNIGYSFNPIIKCDIHINVGKNQRNNRASSCSNHERLCALFTCHDINPLSICVFPELVTWLPKAMMR